jgi:hypothetical protein
MKENEHVDLEQPFKLSVSVEFSFSENDFDNLPPFLIEMKKKVEQKIETLNVDLRNKPKGSLF